MPGSRSDCMAEMRVEIGVAKQAADAREWCDALNHFAQAVQIAVKYYPWPEDFHNEVDTLLSRCVGHIGGQMSACENPNASEEQYLTFRMESHGEKTSIWGVYSARHDFLLGQIRWWGAWRQYTFFPQDDTLYNRSCMREIAAFIDRQMRLWKKERDACE